MNWGFMTGVLFMICDWSLLFSLSGLPQRKEQCSIDRIVPTEHFYGCIIFCKNKESTINTMSWNIPIRRFEYIDIRIFALFDWTKWENINSLMIR